MSLGLRTVLAGAIAVLVLATPAAAQPTMGISETCVYSGGRFVAYGNGFEPGQPLTAEVMGTADPLAGAALSATPLTADRNGDVNVILDVPAAGGVRPVARSVRVRPSPDPSAGAPTVLASTALKTAARAVDVKPAGAAARAGRRETWRVTGVPDGTQLYAHWFRAGRRVADADLGTASDLCGRLAFGLRVLPKGSERAGGWDLWITAQRRFRTPRTGVYIRRRMTVTGDGAGAKVTLAPPESRLLPAAIAALGPVTNAFAADATQIGVIRLLFNRAQGAAVTFYEQIGDRLRQLGVRSAAAGAPTILEDATTWSCERLVRRFVATAILADGSRVTGAHSARTASCADRFRISVPRRVAPGAHAGVRVADRWGIGGIRPQLCVTPPRQRRSCRALAFPAAVTVASRGLRPRRRGLWKLELRAGGQRIRETFGVGTGTAPAARGERVLTTGDSMMQGIDSFLADELGDSAKVRSDIHVGTGLSLKDGEWEQIAAAQVASVKPRTTVISIGAAEGFAMTPPGGSPIACCDEPWVGEYARRVRALMTTYVRGGTGRVFWLTVPAPRLTARAAATKAVNDAIVRAAAGRPGVTLVRNDLIFSPNGYQDSIRYRGRLVRIREVDGIHLSVAGTAIAAKIVAAAMRKRS